MNTKLNFRQQAEKDYHNNKYKNRTTIRSNQSLNAYIFYQNIVDQLTIGRILDFGCGDGWVSIKLAQRGHNVFGIDISIELIKQARERAKHLCLSHKSHFKEMTGENLLFKDNYFDAVVGSAVLHHTDLVMSLGSIHRVLKPGGKGIFIEPMNQNILLKLWRIVTPWRRSPTEHALTTAEINTIKRLFPLTKFTFFIFTSIFSQGLMTIFPNFSILKKFNQILEKIDDKLIRIAPKISHNCAVVVIELIKDKDPNNALITNI